MSRVGKLSSEVNKLIGLYTHLLEMVQEERDILKNVDINQIGLINGKKEKLLIEIKACEKSWTEVACSVGKGYGIEDGVPNLREIAGHLPDTEKEGLMNLHSVLSSLLKRITEINKKNRILVQSALSHVNGAMESITKTFENSPTYEKKGRAKEQSSGGVGRLIAKQV